MALTLVFATNNAHKLEEVQHLLTGSQLHLKSLKDIGCEEEIPETGQTLEENARQKSRFIAERYQLNCFADDSGLEIDALNGEPGVHSAHYSGSRNAEKNVQLVLKKLGDTTNRKAQFKTVISLILNGEEHVFEGTVKGEIIQRASGIGGFGYDPIFRPEGYTQTFAELDLNEKNQISHRAIAMQKLINFLKQQSENLP